MVNLTPFQKEAFMEIVDASLDVTRRTHLFSWLQGSFQALIPHEIMVCGIRTGEGEHIHFDHFSSTRYFANEHLEEATAVNHGVIWRAMAAWTKSLKPVMLADGLAKGEFGSYSVPFVEPEGMLQQVELKNIAAFGVLGHAGVSSFFSFSRVHAPLDAQCAHALQLLVPHLHVMLSRLMVTGIKPLNTNPSPSFVITSREAEILQWVHDGKTNQNIADDLGISALTVKNHVQSILRKLDVQNRSHAAVKAMNLGLIKPAKPKSKVKRPQEKQAYADVIISAAKISQEIEIKSLNAQTDADQKCATKSQHKLKRITKNQKNGHVILEAHTLEQAQVFLKNKLQQAQITETTMPEKTSEDLMLEERLKRKNRIKARRQLLLAKQAKENKLKNNPQQM
jgi:transcriptional regulator EpsA